MVDCQKRNGVCYYQPELVDCKCTDEQMKSRAIVCGNQLQGAQCMNDMKYKCERNNIKPLVLGLC